MGCEVKLTESQGQCPILRNLLVMGNHWGTKALRLGHRPQVKQEEQNDNVMKSFKGMFVVVFFFWGGGLVNIRVYHFFYNVQNN